MRWLVLLAVVGCQRPDVRDSYTIGIDSTFTPDQQLAILDGIEAWTGSVPIKLTYYISLGCNPGGESACIHNSNSAQVIEKSDGDTLCIAATNQGNGDVWVDTARTMQHGIDGFQQTVTHELGHVQGLYHLPPGNIMTRDMNESSKTLTCSDVAEWYSVRGRVAPECFR